MLQSILAGLLVIVGMLAVLLLILAIYLRRSGADLAAIRRFLPNLGGLVTALYRDPRVPTQAKVVLSALLAYLASPFDIIPDFIPLLGYLDDVIVAAIALDGVFNQIDAAVVREHWSGDEQTLAIVRQTAARLSAMAPASWKRRLFAGRPEHDDDD